MSFNSNNKKLYVILALLVLIAGLGTLLILNQPAPVAEPTPAAPEPVVEAPVVVEPTLAPIGQSVEGRTIEAITYGDGEGHLLFIGGVHGGYEWNSILLAYEFIDYLAENPDTIPENVRVSIIPNLNPDGTFVVTGTEGRIALSNIPDPTTRVGEGRFNANGVDLNRNFDCKWAPESTWRGATVSAGTAPFSEPEARALRDFVTTNTPSAVVFWHSQANNVYASECENGILPQTLAVMNAYANAADYGAVESFDAYPITGDAEGWLASLGIPAVTVELQGYQTTEWNRNLAGVEALFNLYRVAR